jgi:hypothetical protein
MNHCERIEEIEEERQRKNLIYSRISITITVIVAAVSLLGALNQNLDYVASNVYFNWISTGVAIVDLAFEWTVRKWLYLNDGRSKYLAAIKALIDTVRRVDFSREPTSEVGRIEQDRVNTVVIELYQNLTYENSLSEVIAS